MLLKRGDRIGRYTIDRLLGEGGMGFAYLAHHEAIAGFKKNVVVKVLQPDRASDPVNVELFMREARVGGRLNHPSIVQIFDIAEERGAHFMAMEYVDGVTLLQATRRCWVQGQGVPMDIAIRVIATAAEGLQYAHTFKHHDGSEAGVVHRDLSPDNLMIARDGSVKVLDFGVARIGGSEATKSGDLKGKIPYMPPEQLKGDLDIDARADLYALGVTLYWCLAGRRPFTGDMGSMMRAITRDAPPSPRTFNPDLPPALEELILRLLEKERDKRLPSASALAAELFRFVSGTRADGERALAAFVERVADVADPVGTSVQGRPAVVRAGALHADHADHADHASHANHANVATGAIRPMNANSTTAPVVPVRSGLQDDTHELAPIVLPIDDETGAPSTISNAPALGLTDDPSNATLRIPHTASTSQGTRAYVGLGIGIGVSVALIVGALMAGVLR